MFRLKELCIQRGISQRQAAHDLGIRESTFSQYANYQREAGYETLVKIADYFGCSVDYLLGRAEDCGLSPDDQQLLSQIRQLLVARERQSDSVRTQGNRWMS